MHSFYSFFILIGILIFLLILSGFYNLKILIFFMFKFLNLFLNL